MSEVDGRELNTSVLHSDRKGFLVNGFLHKRWPQTQYSTDGSLLEFERCVGPRGELRAMQEPPSAERKHKPSPGSHGLFFFFFFLSDAAASS